MIYAQPIAVRLPKLFKMAITSPRILMQFQTFDVCSRQENIFLKLDFSQHQLFRIIL